jgi:hypothetical protein
MGVTGVALDLLANQTPRFFSNTASSFIVRMLARDAIFLAAQVQCLANKLAPTGIRFCC